MGFGIRRKVKRVREIDFNELCLAYVMMGSKVMTKRKK